MLAFHTVTAGAVVGDENADTKQSTATEMTENTTATENTTEGEVTNSTGGGTVGIKIAHWRDIVSFCTCNLCLCLRSNN